MKKMLRLYLPDNLWEWLVQRKKETNTSIAEMVRSAIRDYIKQQGNPAGGEQ